MKNIDQRFSRRQDRLRLVALAVAAVFGAFRGSAQVAAPALLAPTALTALAAGATAVPSSGVVQSQFTGVDLAVITQLQSATLNRVRLPMFAKGERTLTFTRREDYGPGRFALTGTLDGISPSRAVLAVWDGAVTLDASGHAENTVRLRNAGNGGYWIEEVDPAAQGACGNKDDNPSPAPSPAPATPPAQAINQGDGNAYVDLLAYYTPPARDAAGGDAAMASTILSRIATANSVHDGSGTGLRIRLVRLSLMNYSGSHTAADLLNKLENLTDGVMDSVAADITEFGPDLVHLWATFTDGATTNGRGQLPGVFGVNRWDQPSQTLAHESGHNIGCRHQPSGGTNPDPAGTIEHAYEATYDFYFLGIYDSTARAQTIMWGSSESTRVDRFSDPNNTITFTHLILPNSPPIPLGNASSANNAQFIRNNRFAVAQRKEPRFYVAPGGNGQATPYSTANNLNSVYNVWYYNTQAKPTESAVIRVAAGAYSAPTQIATKSRIEKWGGGGSVRIVP